MLTAYIDGAMRRAAYEPLEDDEGWFATIRDFPGLWANGKTVEDTRAKLCSVLEGWIILALRQGEHLSLVNGIDLTPELPSRQAS